MPRRRQDQPVTYSATHSISCPFPGCGARVSETRTSTVSQSDADTQAEAAAWQAFNGANHHHPEKQ